MIFVIKVDDALIKNIVRIMIKESENWTPKKSS